jgi:hypothetical protein
MEFQKIALVGTETPEHRRRVVEVLNQITDLLRKIEAGQVVFGDLSGDGISSSEELTWDGTTLRVGVTQSGVIVTGGNLEMYAGDFAGEDAGHVFLQAGDVTSGVGEGGATTITGGSSDSGAAGKVEIIGGNSSSGDGGDVEITCGDSSSGTPGEFAVYTWVANVRTERVRILPAGDLKFAGTAGSSGQVLKSNGPGSSPTWQTP